ncbi:hypothetical protein [Capnocytophaga sputigena]|uniref:hypothetical protein n=1 Tax=Capnocytophaga sputigena TaxID=1019 RepID=UPI0028ED0B54|nr:hypothetical protein [Capnocytophaga sputigena]
MKVILIQGKANTGKTTLCNRIDEWLLNVKNFSIEDREPKTSTSKIEDFKAIYSKKIDTKEIRIILNSSSDTLKIIDDFKRYYVNNQNNGYDMFVTTIRSPKNVKLNKEVKGIYTPQSEDLVIDMEKSLEEIVNQIQKFFHIVKNL